MTSFSLFNLIGWLLITPLYGYIGMSLWWFATVIVAYIGPGVAITLFHSSSKIKENPDWNEYTARLVLKKGATATDEELLRGYVRGKVLDAGCGIGIHLSQVIEWGAEIAVGVDIGMPGLRHARNLLPSPYVVAASVYQLPFQDGTFDLIYSIDVLEHLSEPIRALAEYYRVCKPGGLVFIQTPNYPIKRIYDLWHFLRGSRDRWEDDPTHVFKFNSAKLISALIHVGFTIEKVTARNLPFQSHIRWSNKLRESLIGRILGQKVIVVAKKPEECQKLSD